MLDKENIIKRIRKPPTATDKKEEHSNRQGHIGWETKGQVVRGLKGEEAPLFGKGPEERIKGGLGYGWSDLFLS
ncbi:hypothetical protein CEXT_232611 [Caerostris extrusa]|uniref:Uncharacterized protein n=1 Tax=Caerostris extrusa TaxID=172846 RepID=A0AAV4X4Y4_CAEEX|nr:hypothetical protein CEXT_232611 [Caerostris extrusa]